MALSRLKKFCIPENSHQVDDCVAEYGDNALILAGGTFIRGLEVRGLLSEVEALIDVHKLGMDGLVSGVGNVRIGAMVTFAALEQLAELHSAAWLAAVRDALACPPLQIRNMATVGGCLAASCPFYDLPTAFLALDGSVTVSGAGAQREIGLADLFVSLFENSLEPGELITELTLPRPPGRSASAFIKLEGTANDLAIVNVAVSISVDAAGVCEEARVVLGGGVGDRVVRSATAETVLKGQQLTHEVIEHAAAAVGQDIEPMADHRATAAYRLAMAGVFTKRALNQALSRLN